MADLSIKPDISHSLSLGTLYAPVLWKRDNFWLYGVVEPLSGWHFCQEYDRLNTQRFQEFIDALSHQLGDDIALIQLDQAGAHVTSALRWPDNLIPVCQPAHSPEQGSH